MSFINQFYKSKLCQIPDLDESWKFYKLRKLKHRKSDVQLVNLAALFFKIIFKCGAQQPVYIMHKKFFKGV